MRDFACGIPDKKERLQREKAEAFLGTARLCLNVNRKQ